VHDISVKTFINDDEVQKMSEMKKRYRHYKGKEYEVLYEALHSENLEELVVYRALYDDFKIWVRPKRMFFEDIMIDGIKVPRFSCIDDGLQYALGFNEF
jgi:hypothetical protein